MFGAADMKLVGADIVLLVVGVVLFATAGTALVQGGYLAANGGGAASPTGAYNVAYSTSELKLAAQTVADMTSADLATKVTTANVTKAVVRVDCSDSVPAGGPAFTLTVTVTAPNGLKADPVTKPCGTIEIDVAVAPVPPPGTVQGGTPKEAAKNLGASADAAKAEGDWKVHVAGFRGTAGALPVVHPSGSMSLSVLVWRATVAAVPK